MSVVYHCEVNRVGCWIPQCVWRRHRIDTGGKKEDAHSLDISHVLLGQMRLDTGVSYSLKEIVYANYPF